MSVQKTILFVDNEEPRPQSISILLATGGYELIVAKSGKDGIEKAFEFKGIIHLVLANVELADMSGIELAQRLRTQRPDIKHFLLSQRKSGMLVLDHGWQFLPMPFVLDMLKTRIRDILKEPESTRPRHSPRTNDDSVRRRTTERETQVLKLIADGKSTKQIATILGIAFKTVVGHRTRMMNRVKIHDSASLVRYAIRIGIVDP
jgi:DNA-binding NarL/FixJ family response regulator